MANIFRSKDIYKRLPNASLSDEQLRVVTGVYVIGEYKPPYYIGPCLQITDINTNRATVVDYTIQNTTHEDHVVNLINIDAIGNLKITNYTRDEAELQPDHVVNLINIDASTDPLNIVYYTTEFQDVKSDHVVNLVNIDADTSPLDIVYYSTKKYPTNPEPMLRIKSITTTKSTVTNIEQ